MADNLRDVITNVTTVDIQLLDEKREDTTTIKLDNPVGNITREMVSAAMQSAFTNQFLLTNKGSVAMYLGDVTVNQSIKRKLEGQDFYVTPTELTLNRTAPNVAKGTINVSGATIQGYNILWLQYPTAIPIIECKITNNGLSLDIKVLTTNDTAPPAGNFTVELVIMGTIVAVPVTVPSA